MIEQIVGLIYKVQTAWKSEVSYQQTLREAIAHVTAEQAGDVLRAEPGSHEWRDGLMLLTVYLKQIEGWES